MTCTDGWKVRQAKRLRFRQICATLERVRTRDEVSSGGQAPSFSIAFRLKHKKFLNQNDGEN